MGELCAALGCRKSTGIGILHLLWEWAADYVPQGDIGKYSDRVIANAVDWDGDPQDLILKLTEAKWVDKHPEHRLVIHDWPEHCEDSTHIKLARQVLDFADGSRPRLTRLHAKEREEIERIYVERESARANARDSAQTRTAYAYAKPMPVPGEDAPACAPPEEPYAFGAESSAPADMPMLNYARWLLEHCHLPKTFQNQQAVSEAIGAFAREHKLANHEATDRLTALARDALAANLQVDRFWFEDGKYRNGGKVNGAGSRNGANARVRDNREAVRRAAQCRGWIDADSPGGADGGSVSTPGAGRIS